jgi:hypothetical protein
MFQPQRLRTRKPSWVSTWTCARNPSLFSSYPQPPPYRGTEALLESIGSGGRSATASTPDEQWWAGGGIAG